MPVEIVYETHAPTTDNEAGVATGWLPGRLSEAGRRCAADLGRRRRADGFSVVFTSDLNRAVQTAEIAFAGSAVPIQADRRLRECDFGVLTGAAVAALAPTRVRHIQHRYPGGQSYADVVAAMRGFLAEVAREWDGRRILLVGHSATRWALSHLIDRVALEQLVTEPFTWQAGWHYSLPTPWSPQ